MIDILALPAFSDNYIWLIHDGTHAAVVDPGDAEPVRAALAEHGLRLRAVLVTHHHADHVGGVAELAATARAAVYGPASERARLPLLDVALQDGQSFELAEPGALHFTTITVPGHTRGHIALYERDRGWLFCGDTLFAAGCGRLFEGSPQQMYASLSRLAALPGHCQVFCAHEYTLANLAFAQAVEPDNRALTTMLAHANAQRAACRPTLPSRLSDERAVNPFLRCRQPAVIASARAHGADSDDPAAVFAALRRWKDVFRPPAT
ncbi:MAG: hydroxyacylglutathione hydrolase [Gammaproteobacteria bacterium]|nr:hydroxyacylglutathione hydrolase [Gammaproteobacteria bacterium]